MERSFHVHFNVCFQLNLDLSMMIWIRRDSWTFLFCVMNFRLLHCTVAIVLVVVRFWQDILHMIQTFKQGPKVTKKERSSGSWWRIWSAVITYVQMRKMIVVAKNYLIKQWKEYILPFAFNREAWTFFSACLFFKRDSFQDNCENWTIENVWFGARNYECLSNKRVTFCSHGV